MFTCKRCKNKVKIELRDNHELYCAYSLKNGELTNLIPCEVCNNLINFEDYQSHLYSCGEKSYYTRQVRVPLIFPSLNISGSGNAPSVIDTSVDQEEIVVPLINPGVDNAGLEVANADEVAGTGLEVANAGPEVANANAVAGLEVVGADAVAGLEVAGLEVVGAGLEVDNANEVPQTFMTHLRTIFNEHRSLLTIPPQILTEGTTNIPFISSLYTQLQPPPTSSVTTQNPVTNDSGFTYDDEDNIDMPDHISSFISSTMNSVMNNAANSLFFLNPSYGDDYEQLTVLGENIGYINPGVLDINAIAPKELLSEEITCPICTDTVKEVRKTVCNHSFCPTCIEEWLSSNKKCPICMNEFDTNNHPEADE